MIIKSKEQIDYIYNFLTNVLKFKPSIKKDECAFDKNIDFLIYNIKNMNLDNISVLDDYMFNIFSKIDENLDFYVVDYQHGTFLSNIKKVNEDINNLEKVFYPSFYPDGDYYFFIDKDFRFGYLSHPWKEEVYIFGDLLKEIMLKESEFFENYLKWEKI